MIPNVGIGDKKQLEVCLVSKIGSMPRDWYMHEESRKKKEDPRMVRTRERDQ